MNDGVITSGGTEKSSTNLTSKYLSFNGENPIEDENSDEDIPDELKRDFVDEEDDYHSVYDAGAPNHTSTPRRYIIINIDFFENKM